MITIEQAISKYNKKNPGLQIESILDAGDEWIVSACDKETKMEIDASPIAINKETGDFRVFFPPIDGKKLKNAKQVNLDMYNID